MQVPPEADPADLTMRVDRFPVADVAWTFAMAIDVWLIVFRSYDTEALKRLEWKYALGITIFTFTPAFTFLFVKTEEKGPMYGSVTVGGPRNIRLHEHERLTCCMQMWCAIAPKWVLFRIVMYYVSIWYVSFPYQTATLGQANIASLLL